MRTQPWGGRGYRTDALRRTTQQLTLGLFSTVLLFATGCNESNPNVDISSTPLATPIVVTSNPLSPTPSSNLIEPKPKDHLVERVGATIEESRKGFPGRSSVVFLDLESDARLAYGEEARFESASLMKLLVLAELHKDFQMGTRAPTDKIILKEEHQVGGSGQLKKAKPGTSYTLEELATVMITESDNTATQMLTDLIGLKTLTESAIGLGLAETTIERDIYDFAAIDRGKDNYITGRDASIFLKLLARDQLPGSQKMHEILEKQKRNDMIGSGIPEGVRIAHKTGELNGILHDAGIVYAPRGAYVLVMLGDEVTDKAKATASWSTLSQEVFTIYNEASPTPTPAIIP